MRLPTNVYTIKSKDGMYAGFVRGSQPKSFVFGFRNRADVLQVRDILTREHDIHQRSANAIVIRSNIKSSKTKTKCMVHHEDTMSVVSSLYLNNTRFFFVNHLYTSPEKDVMRLITNLDPEVFEVTQELLVEQLNSMLDQ